MPEENMPIRQGRKKINSNRKGKTGEREWAEYLRDHGIKARRGQQFAGGHDSPDVVTNLRNVHFEVKRKEAGNPYEWLTQAVDDGKGKIPIVAHRRNQRGWIVILRAEDFLNNCIGEFLTGDEISKP